MTNEEVLECLKYEREALADARGSDYSGVIAIDTAIEAIEQQSYIEKSLVDAKIEVLLEIKDILIEYSTRDKRTISHPVHSVENDMYYDGMYNALGIIKRKIWEFQDLS